MSGCLYLKISKDRYFSSLTQFKDHRPQTHPLGYTKRACKVSSQYFHLTDFSGSDSRTECFGAISTTFSGRSNLKISYIYTNQPEDSFIELTTASSARFPVNIFSLKLRPALRYSILIQDKMIFWKCQTLFSGSKRSLAFLHFLPYLRILGQCP